MAGYLRVDDGGAYWNHADERVLLNEYLWTFDVDYLKVMYLTLPYRHGIKFEVSLERTILRLLPYFMLVALPKVR